MVEIQAVRIIRIEEEMLIFEKNADMPALVYYVSSRNIEHSLLFENAENLIEKVNVLNAISCY